MNMTDALCLPRAHSSANIPHDCVFLFASFYHQLRQGIQPSFPYFFLTPLTKPLHRSRLYLQRGFYTADIEHIIQFKIRQLLKRVFLPSHHRELATFLNIFQHSSRLIPFFASSRHNHIIISYNIHSEQFNFYFLVYFQQYFPKPITNLSTLLKKYCLPWVIFSNNVEVVKSWKFFVPFSSSQ